MGGRGLGGWARVRICPDGEVEEPLVASPSSQSALVQRLLFYPDGGVEIGRASCRERVSSPV